MLVLDGLGVGDSLVGLEEHPFGTIVIVRGLVCGDQPLYLYEFRMAIVALFLELSYLVIPERRCPLDVEIELLGVIVHAGKEGRKVCTMLEAALFQLHPTGFIDKDDRQVKTCLLLFKVFRKQSVLGKLDELQRDALMLDNGT